MNIVVIASYSRRSSTTVTAGSATSLQWQRHALFVNAIGDSELQCATCAVGLVDLRGFGGQS